MPNRMHPATQLTVELTPSARVDVIDVKKCIGEHFRHLLDGYKRILYCSHHTTAGYFDEELVGRLDHSPESVHGFLKTFHQLFPPEGSYQHDQLHLREELTENERRIEPLNGDSHLKYIGSGLESCVSYHNAPHVPVYFVDLDGVVAERPRQRLSTIVGFNDACLVDQIDLRVPVSGHAIDSINLKNDQFGLFSRLEEIVRRYGIDKGWIELDLHPEESGAGLTINEYETLLMKYDLAEVLRNPLRHAAARGRSILRDPLAIPGKARNYLKYDLVRVVNQALDALGLDGSFVERVVDRLFAFPASRFLRMKRSVRLLVCDAGTDRHGRIVQGRYQSPILVQWEKAASGSRRMTARLRECL